MPKKFEIFKCDMCSQVVEVTSAGAGTLVCCNQDMKLLEEYEAQKDNPHFAHIEETSDIQKRVYFNHPMSKEHYIEYIEIISHDHKYLKRKYLTSDDIPEISFKCDCKEGFYVRLYCNCDGVWVTK